MAYHETKQGAITVDIEAVFRVASLLQDVQNPVQIVHRPPDGRADIDIYNGRARTVAPHLTLEGVVVHLTRRQRGHLQQGAG